MKRHPERKDEINQRLDALEQQEIDVLSWPHPDAKKPETMKFVVISSEFESSDESSESSESELDGLFGRTGTACNAGGRWEGDDDPPKKR